jgi:DNA-binding NtrC family response regulator
LSGGPSPREGALKHYILAVDDDRPMRLLLKRILENDGHRVEVADGAESAAAAFARRPFSLVISDVVMPGRSGLELREELAQAEPDVPWVLISGADIEGGLRYAAARYRTVFLAKPFDPEELLRVVENTPHPGQHRAAVS